jgi:biopolymer transport protein ExbB
MKKILPLLFLFLLLPQAAQAWWNGDWSSRKQITLDTTANGLPIKEEIANAVVLVRLHGGNFSFTDANVDGSDLRFIAEDDTTPLKYHVEKFDPTAEIALVWVQVPKLQPNSKERHIYLYYGNENATAAGDAKGSYDVNQTAVYHFDEGQGTPRDATAYDNHASQFDGTRIPGGMIGPGVAFDGKQSLVIPASPSMKLTGANGATVSLWVKPGAAGNAPLVAIREAGKSLVVNMEGSTVYAKVEGPSGTIQTQPAGNLAPGSWHHVAVTVGKDLTVYVDGQAVGTTAAVLPDLQGEITVGKGFQGEMDELEFSNVARSADAIFVAAVSQGPNAKLLAYGADESNDSGGQGSYFGVILKSVTLDGWVVIAILIVMMVFSWMVMVSKALVIGKTAKDNQQFMEAFHKLKTSEMASLDTDDSKDDSDLKDSAVMMALFGKHDHYQSSSLYRIYHAGVQEVKHRFAGSNGTNVLSPQSIQAIKATLDGTIVRENQKLNNLMVLLTIAISGGPFLGLLGTVVGVMITFAAIAATGDVNVAAIAPGIAAALVATVAGLAVAIPSLFGYNYLGSRIKNISADMQVFVDELVGRFAEAYGR